MQKQKSFLVTIKLEACLLESQHSMKSAQESHRRKNTGSLNMPSFFLGLLFAHIVVPQDRGVHVVTNGFIKIRKKVRH